MRRASGESLGTRALRPSSCSTWGWDINSARRAQLERRVEGGGRLVVDAALITGSDAFEEWSGIAREREEPDRRRGFSADGRRSSSLAAMWRKWERSEPRA